MGTEIITKIEAHLEEAYEVRVNDLDRSVELASQALELSKSISNKHLIARSLSQLALFKMIRAEYDESIVLSEEAITFYTELEDEKGIADAKYNIAGVYYKTNNLHSGLMHLADCLKTYRKFNDYHQQAKVLKSMGTIYEYFGDEQKAVDTYLASVEAARKAESLNLESNALNPLSGIYLNRGFEDRAMKVIEQSIKMKNETQDIRGLAFALYGRAKIYTSLLDFEKAEKDFKDAIDIHVEMGERLGLGMAHHKLGYMYSVAGRKEEAKKYLTLASDFGKKWKVVLINFKCNYLLYQIYKEEGNTKEALRFLENYITEKEAVINSQTLKVIENYDIISKMDSLEKEAQMQREKAEILEKKNVAEQTAKVKEEFLSTMSHEIRTPLNAVISIASLLEKTENTEESMLIETLNFSAKNLLNIINDILDFSKLESGKIYLDKSPLSLEELTTNIIQVYGGLAKEKGVDLTLEFDKTVSGFHYVDETKLSQILGNLVSNAIKFTDKGEVKLKITKQGLKENSDVIRFSIEDTGCGISEEFKHQLFESFSQSNATYTKNKKGSGLGLAIVKKLVNLHESEIYVESTLDEGSTFYFDIEMEKSDSTKQIPSNNSKTLEGISILVSEDNRINTIILSKILAKWGVEFDIATNGQEALECIKNRVYDYIFMDIHMPILDGFEATKRIKTGGSINNNTPIYALTADVAAEQKEEYSSYFDGFLLKPFETEKIYSVLAQKNIKKLSFHKS